MSFEGALGKLNESYFFREFTFSSNKFKPSRKAELELADAVVWLDDFLIITQVKERYASFGATAADEENWFNNEVLKKAVAQVGNTLSYLQTFESIDLENNQGHRINLANAKDKYIHKLIIYHSDQQPPDRILEKFIQSPTARVVHIVRSTDYFEILQTLVTPVEVHEYLQFRAKVIEIWGEVVSGVSEQALLGQFLRNIPELRPSPVFVDLLIELRRKARNNAGWDIGRIIHLFAERRTTSQKSPTDYYEILKELAKLNRTDMAMFKERFSMSMKMANEDKSVLPYRFVGSSGCGFVFIPLRRAQMGSRHAALRAFTDLNKYDLKLSRCVGLTFVAEGSETWCDVQWYRSESPWVRNAKTDAALKENYPFRPIKEAVVERYGFDL